MTALYPFLAVRDTDRAIAFYETAFGACVVQRLEAPDGPVVAVLEVDGQPFGVATEAPVLGTPSPETAGGTTVRVSLEADDPMRRCKRPWPPARRRCSRSPTSRTGCGRAASSTR